MIKRLAVNLHEYAPLNFWMERDLYSLSDWTEIINEEYKKQEQRMKKGGKK